MAPHLRAASEKRGFAHVRLLTDWDEIVGPEIARLARPLKVGYARSGFGATLTVLVTGAAAPQVQMMTRTIIDRVNACYGYSAISRVTLTQTAPGEAMRGFAEGQAEFAPRPRRLSPEREQAMQSDLCDVEDEGLRAALMSLGTNIETKRR
nr:DciA family protein [Roseobacter sp. HKCCA0434]